MKTALYYSSGCRVGGLGSKILGSIAPKYLQIRTCSLELRLELGSLWRGRFGSLWRRSRAGRVWDSGIHAARDVSDFVHAYACVYAYVYLSQRRAFFQEVEASLLRPGS